MSQPVPSPNIWTLVRRVHNWRSFLQLLSFSIGSTLADKYDLILALRRQIFKYLPERFGVGVP